MKYWESIIDRLQMSEVVRDCGLYVNRGGFVCCPFHNEKTPSMKVYDKSYYCFGCHSHGNVITFTEKYYNLPFKDACMKLNNQYNLGLEGMIDQHLNKRQIEMLRAKLRSEEIRKQELVIKKRIESGHIECSDIDIKYEDLFYETIKQSSLNELLVLNGMEDYIDHNNYNYSKPNIIKRFKYELVGTPDFDNKVEEYIKKADALWKNALLNKKILEEEQNEQNI